MQTAVFLDFQGTIGGEGLDDIRSLHFYPFSVEAIKKLNDNGILAIGITNQSRIGKGHLTWDDYEQKLAALEDELHRSGAHLDAVYCCPHIAEDNCQCKKPLTGMVDAARWKYRIDLRNSYVVGDMGDSDMVLAANIGAKGVLVLTGVGRGSLTEYRYTWENVQPHFIAENVLEAVEWILADLASVR